MKNKTEGYAHLTAKIDRLKSELSKAQAEIVRLKAKAHAELAKAVAKERERCARVCDEMDEAFVTIYGTDYTDFQNDPRYLQMAADAIRKGE